MNRRVRLLLFLILFVGIIFKTGTAQTDSLIVRNGFGDPGSAGNIVSVDLKNSTPVGKMQFTLGFDPSLLSVSDVLPTGRTGAMSTFNWSEPVPGQVTVFIWDLEGDTIGSGSGSVADFSIDVASGVDYGEIPLILSGVGVQDAENQMIPTTAVNGLFVIPEPDILLSATSHNYGQVVVGETSVWNVTVSNIGTKDLTINYITSSSGEFTVETAYPQSLQPDSSLEVTLTFAPASEGPKSAKVYIVSDDPDENMSTITLSGSGIAPDISVSATNHDYGSVMGYDTENWVLTIYNHGSTANLIVHTISSNNSDFEVFTPTFPRVVPIGRSLDVTIAFTPTQLGLISGTLTIYSNDPDENVLPISLLGTGYYTPVPMEVVGGSGQEDSYGNVVPVDMDNEMAVGFIQFRFNYPPSLLTVSGVRPTERASNMSYFHWSETTPGIVDVLIGDLVGSVVNPGLGTVVEFLIDVDPEAVPGDAHLVLSDVVLRDKSSNPITPQPENGIFTILPAPDIEVSADSLYFDDVLVGDSLGLAIHIYNLGTIQLRIDSVVIEPNEFVAQFPTLPQVISSGDSLEGMLFFRPMVLGSVTGSIVIFSDDPNEGQKQVRLVGRGVLPDIEVTSPSLNFGDVWVTDTSTAIVSIFNIGTADLTVQSLFVSPIQFEVSSNPLPVVIPSSDTLDLLVSFHPTAVGLVNGSLTIQSNDPDEGLKVIQLFGTGIDPEIDLSATNHMYGDVLLGEFRDWMLTVRNLGLTDLVLDSVLSNHSDFSPVDQTFPKIISANDSSVVTVRFSPSAIGERLGVVSVFSNDQDESSIHMNVSGIGVVPDIHIPTTTHDYGQVVVNTSSDWVFMVTNLAVGKLILKAITTNNSDFTIIDPVFPDTVTFGDSLAVTARFQPSKTGPISGILKIMSNDPDESPLSISVGGTGVVPDIALSTFNHYFGLGVLCDTVSWVLKVYNVGTADLTVDTAFADTADYAVLGLSFPLVVVPNDTLEMTVGFLPSQLGDIIGKLYVVTDDPDEDTVSVSLTGIAVAPDIDLSASAHDFGSVPIGYSNEWAVIVTNLGSSALTIDSAYTSSSAFQLHSLSFPQTLLPGDEVSIVVSFSPTHEGQSAASLTLLNDDCDEKMANVMLSGAGYSVIVELPDTSAMPAQILSVPIHVDDVTGLEIYSWEVSVSFDQNHLTALRAFSEGAISHVWGSPTYSITPGKIDIQMSGISPLVGSGALVYTAFSVDSTLSSGDSTMLHFDDFQFNDGAPAVDTLHGLFHINRPPNIDSMSDKTAHEGLPLSFEVTATDPDRDPLTFWAANLPSGASFDSETHTFHWTPDFGTKGIYPGVTFHVSDGQFSDSTTVSIHVESSMRVMVPDTTRPAGANFALPIILFDTLRTEDSVYSFDLTLTYDPDVLTALDAMILGAFTEHWGFIAYKVTEGQIVFGIVGQEPLGGTGVLVYINFAVSTGVVSGDSCVLTLTEFQFNDGDPAAFTIPGVLKIPLYSISGAVRYYMTHSPGVPIDSTLLEITGGHALSSFSDENGNFTFEDLVGGLGYAIRPSKDGDHRDGLTAYDASLVTRSIVGLESLNELQDLAADVTGNGTISPLDASQILQFIVGIIDRFGIGRDWTFIPNRRDYPYLDANYTEQGFTGILYGDVSGNWGETGGSKLKTATRDWIEIPQIEGSPGLIVHIPVVLRNGGDVFATDMDVSFDPDFMQVLDVVRTPLTSEFLLEHKVTEGHLRIAAAGTRPMENDGRIIEIMCRISPKAQLGDLSPFEVFVRLNEMWLPPIMGNIAATSVLPTEYALAQNCPNPFNPSTDIRYQIADGRYPIHTTLKIYNILGQEVRTLVDEMKEPGSYTVSWDGTDASGNDVASGVYFYRLDVGNFSATKRMMLMK